MRRRSLAALMLLCAILAAACAPADIFPRAQAPETAVTRVQIPEAAVTEEGAPDFSGVETEPPRIEYGPPDALGRATGALAVLTRGMLTDAPREDMSGIRLPGMHNAYYDFIEDGWVYHRCHLIGHRFGGASSPENLIAGTQALNLTFMLPWEDRIADCLRRGVPVMMRVTPLYGDGELICAAVRIEAVSLDGGRRLSFSVLCPNVQPGVAIDRATGWTTLADDWAGGGTEAAPRTYVINTRTGRFHLPGCEGAEEISRRSRREETCARGELLARGLVPCGMCRP